MARLISRTLRRLAFCPDLAVDVGTATTRLCLAGRTRLFERPSVANPSEGRRWGLSRRRDDEATRPPGGVPALSAGVVVDCDAAATVIETLFRNVRRFGIVRPRVLACAPTDVSAHERFNLVRAVEIAGGRPIDVVPEPLAAAIGAGLDVSSPFAQMIVDIGEGVTDIAVIQSGCLIGSSAIRVACSELHAAIRNAVATRHGVDLPVEEAGRLTRVVGAVFPSALPEGLPVRSIGRDGRNEVNVTVRRQDLWNAVNPVYTRIAAQVDVAMKVLPSPVACQVIESGICLTGGGALLRGMADRIFAATRVSTRVAEYPLRAVIDGARIMLTSRVEADLLE